MNIRGIAAKSCTVGELTTRSLLALLFMSRDVCITHYVDAPRSPATGR